MKKLSIKFVSFLLSLLLVCTALVGCDTSGGETGGTHGTQGTALPAPEIRINKEGVATWDSVDGAIYYVYTIDGGNEEYTVERELQLTEGQTLCVKAVSGTEGKDDSPFSLAVTYHAADTAELSIYAVNDLHGKFMDSSNQPGLDEFTTYLNGLYADTTRAEVLLSSGDMWQGTVESSSNKGELMTEWMNEVGFVSMTLGNHEFDWGEAKLSPNSEMADFPFLGINVTYNGSMPDYCKASVVVERAGVKIGIIGAIGDCLSSISGEFQTGLSFATGGMLTALVKNESTRLRNEENCDLIVYSIHDGGDKFPATGITSVKDSEMSYYDSSLSNGYVDLVFEAHTHKQYILKDEYGVYHLQGGGENKAISCADISFNKVTKDFSVTPRLINSNVYGKADIEDAPIVEELYSKYFPDAENDPYKKTIGVNYAFRDSDEIGERVAALYYEKGMETWGENYQIMLAGGYLKTRNPYDLTSGAVTYADLYSLLPFDNAIVLGRIRGSNLKRRFLQSTSSSYHIYVPSGVTEASISDSEMYYIVVDTYTAYYRSNNITEVARLDNETYARDLLADFISEAGWA